VELVLTHAPAIALVDLGLPDIDGFEVTRRITAAGSPTRVILVSGRISTDLVQQAFDAGAWGYVSKVSSVDLLPDAIDAVLAGARYVDREVADDLARAVQDVLDDDELQVLAHMAAGRDDHAIASHLRLDVEQVARHVDDLLAKLGYASRDAAISHAILQGMAE
jgi:two-component system response regulator DesR